MGPKKTDPTLKDDYWRTRIETAPLNDDTWSVQVVMIEVAGSDQDNIYLNKFEKSAADVKRFVIRNICKSETMFMVNQLGGEKKEKDENLRVFEEGQAYLKDKKDIPADIQALIVKHLILNMKDEYLFIQRQKLLVREGLHRESATMVNRTEVRTLVTAPTPDTTQPQSPSSKKNEVKPIPTEEPQEGKKFNTVLRVRGEEWRDKVYVDDFPLDGPNLYVAVTGFLEPLLAGCLITIGVPLTAICQIRIDLTAHHIPSGLIPPTKRVHSDTELMLDKSLSYWQTLQELRINKSTAQDYNDTAFILFSPPYWDADDLSGNADKIYDELCFLMYDIQDLTRQRCHYLKNMDVINIPTECINESYINDYLQHIDSVKLECCTMYSILDSILQAVCTKEIDNIATSFGTMSSLQKPSSTEEPAIKTSFAAPSNLQQQYSPEETKVQLAETLINNIFNVLNPSDSSKKSYRLTCREEAYEEPIVIQNGNLAKCQTFHLNNMELDHIVLSMLWGMPINRLWLNQERPKDELEAKLSFHINVLLSCFDRSDVESVELNRLLHIAACRKLYSHRSSLKKTQRSATTISEFKKHYLKRTVLAEPLAKCVPICVSSNATSRSFPSMTNVKNSSTSTYTSDSSNGDKVPFLFDLPDLSELVTVAEVTSNEPYKHVIDDFELFEDFTNTCSFQVLHEAFNSFNCLDYHYCEITDTFNLMFFNSHDRNGISREEWRSHIPTPVCLQDFFDFILEEHHDWIKNEEDVFEQKRIQYSQSLGSGININAGTSCIQNQDVATELVIEGSLKFQELRENEVLEEQESSVQTKNTPSAPASTIVSSKSTKTGKSTKITKTTTITSPAISLNDSRFLVDIFMPFRGYDLGEKRVEVYGKDDAFYSKDGTRVFCRYTFIIPMNLEYITLHIVPGNGSNEFWVHRFTGEGETSDIDKGCESFRITSKDRVAINIKKELYCVPIAIDTSLDDNVQPKIKEPPTSQEKLTIPQTETYHSLCITWPNGLITETVHEENSPIFSHIKQYYLTQPPDLDEEMRCISMNGEVILFKKSGDIEIFKHDGTYTKITKCEKRVEQSSTNLISSPIDNKKNKKEVSKKELHDKKEVRGSAKSPSKASKKNVNEPEIDDPPIKLEYKLFIDEFEIIEPNGLHQQWTGEFSIDIEKILIRTVTDYCSGEIMSRRMDGTQILLNKDGIQIVTFPNQTRIITKFVVEDEEIYPDWTEKELDHFDSDSNSVKSIHSSIKEESNKKIRTDGYISVQTYFIIEHENFATVIMSKPTGKVTIDSPNGTSVTLDMKNHYEIKLDTTTTATFNGEDLNIEYVPCLECQSNTKCKIKICPDVHNSVNKMQEPWVELEDSLGKKVVVNDEGAIQLLEERYERVTTSPVGPDLSHKSVHVENLLNIEPGDTASHQPDQSESTIEHEKCREMFSAKEMRFFILRRDLTCSELVHRDLVERDKQLCRIQPWCSINEYDTFGDNRSLLTMLTPVSHTESEKWVMLSKFTKFKKAFGDKEIDCGNNFYHWMRPYRRFKPDTYGVTVMQGLPRAFIMRVLENQYKKKIREKMKGGRELLRAVLRYRRLMETDSEAIVKTPLVDYRPDSEHLVDDAVQALAHRVYEEMKQKLDKTVQSDDQLDITTIPPTPKYWSSKLIQKAQGDSTEEVPESLIEAVQVQKMSENLKRYWRRREEEYKEEQFYLYLLREGNVPEYFRNLLGGAIWWEVNNVAAKAIDIAQMTEAKLAPKTYN